jgi:hypothetical protein
LMTPSLPLHGVASALFRRKYVPGAGLRPVWGYWSRQRDQQRSRECSFRRRGTRRKARVFAANRLEGEAQVHRGGLPTAREEAGVVRRVCPSSHGVDRCRLVSLFTGEEWRKAKGEWMVKIRAKR